MTTFDHAVANWKRAQAAAEENTGYHSTCGSAERLYASNSERHRHAREVEVPVDGSAAAAFESLVKGLTDEQRLAWHVKHGFRPQPKEPEIAQWIDTHYISARAALALQWHQQQRRRSLA